MAEVFLYGTTAGQLSGGLSTHARAISVFPAVSDADTRIVICGDTHDAELPLQGSLPIYTAFQNLFPAGFLAVYDGAGTLLWSYHFFGQDTGASTAISDVSIRVDNGVSPPRDVITYCGLSTNGNFLYTGGGTVPNTMQPLLPFAPPPSLGPCFDTYRGGDLGGPAVLLQTQFDGLVGRLSAPHIQPVPASPVFTLEFHSIVGGGAQDGLLGITEIDADHFAVVGVTQHQGSQNNLVFPLTRSLFTGTTQLCLGNGGWGSFGVIMVFDASPTHASPQQNLLLVGSTLIGSFSAGSLVPDTIARDVLWHGGLLYAVGSTNDPTFCSSFPLPFEGALTATRAGFVITCGEDPNVGFTNASYFRGQSMESALTGVGAWSEYPDHIAVVGWAKDTSQLFNIVVASLFRDTTQGGPFFPLKLLREFEIAQGLLGNEFPGTYAPAVATIPAAFNSAPVEGGAIGVDPRGLITVVGSTFGSTDYPVTPAVPGAWAAGRGHQWGHGTQPTEPDAILSVVDMLPNGVCRSDRTGDRTGACFGWPTSGDGGTTPLCALPVLGGVVSPVGPMNRMMVDFEGSPVAGAQIAILVDRPPPSAVSFGVWQLGFPSSSPNTAVFPSVEFWANTSTPILLPQASAASLREPLFPAGLPSGSNTFSIQYICLLSQSLCGDPALMYAGSPAIVVSY